MGKRLLIEGWRAIHHSYALVAQAHCLCLLRLPGIELRFRDLPYYYDTWKPTRGLFAAEEQAAIAGIAAPEPSFLPEATLSMRAERPDFSPPPSGRKLVFGTPEHRVLVRENLGGIASAAEVPREVHAITPSRWTAVAYERFGFEPERIHVVPHGIDPAVIHPDEASRRAARANLGVQDAFVFMSVGAMTPNKGIASLLAALAEVAIDAPHARLLLKGADDLYPSKDLLRQALDTLSASARERVATRLLYQGKTFSARAMAAFLRAADCYVAPYLAEGFNMPVLEALGSGVAAICTGGGPTDEFTDASFAARIRSRIVPVRVSETETGDMLAPDFDDLLACMKEALRDPERTRERGRVAARFVAERYTWDDVTDLLLAALFD